MSKLRRNFDRNSVWVIRFEAKSQGNAIHYSVTLLTAALNRRILTSKSVKFVFFCFHLRGVEFTTFFSFSSRHMINWYVSIYVFEKNNDNWLNIDLHTWEYFSIYSIPKNIF